MIRALQSALFCLALFAADGATAIAAPPPPQVVLNIVGPNRLETRTYRPGDPNALAATYLLELPEGADPSWAASRLDLVMTWGGGMSLSQVGVRVVVDENRDMALDFGDTEVPCDVVFFGNTFLVEFQDDTLAAREDGNVQFMVILVLPPDTPEGATCQVSFGLLHDASGAIIDTSPTVRVEGPPLATVGVAPAGMPEARTMAVGENNVPMITGEFVSPYNTTITTIGVGIHGSPDADDQVLAASVWTDDGDGVWSPGDQLLGTGRGSVGNTILVELDTPLEMLADVPVTLTITIDILTAVPLDTMIGVSLVHINGDEGATGLPLESAMILIDDASLPAIAVTGEPTPAGSGNERVLAAFDLDRLGDARRVAGLVSITVELAGDADAVSRLWLVYDRNRNGIVDGPQAGGGDTLLANAEVGLRETLSLVCDEPGALELPRGTGARLLVTGDFAGEPGTMVGVRVTGVVFDVDVSLAGLPLELEPVEVAGGGDDDTDADEFTPVGTGATFSAVASGAVGCQAGTGSMGGVLVALLLVLTGLRRRIGIG